MAHMTHNRITKLIDPRGIAQNTHKEMENVIVQHFQRIAKETMEDISQFTKGFTHHISKLVTKEDNHKLNKPITGEEVYEAVKEMHNGKAPGPNAFNVDFFKT